MWKIPVQGRFGCGYVFDSRLVSDDDIKKEITEYLGHEPNFPRVFDFEPGVYEKTWINNCIAIGLSSGFVEPLEATSIQVSTFALRAFSTKIQGIFRDRKRAQEEFNYEINRINYHILNFLHFHYLSKRADSEFWTEFKQRTAEPDFVNKFADVSKKTFPKEREFVYLDLITKPSAMQSKNPFSIFSWHMVGAGIKYFKPNIAERELESYKKFDMPTSEAKLKSVIKEVADTALDHHTYIEKLKSL
jgi:tryptophan halogenase